jgi:putative transposase
MANTYTQMNLHAVFVVNHRTCLITENYKDQLCSYIAGTLKGMQCYPLAINGHLDHVHLLYEMNTTLSVADQLGKLKSNSSKWVNDLKFLKKDFQWQQGYAAFTISKRERDKVIKYINNQESHHKEVAFKDEYLNLLKEHDIIFDERYLFEFRDHINP